MSQASNDRADRPDRPTAAPFLGALAIVAVVIAAIVVFNRNSGDGDAQQIGRAVVGQNDALQRQDYRAFVTYTCRAQQGNEQEFLTHQRDSVVIHGERYVDGVTEVKVDGDKAVATTTYHFDKTADTTSSHELSMVREDGAWKVCSA